MQIVGPKNKTEHFILAHAAAAGYAVGAGILVTRFGPQIEPTTYSGNFWPIQISYPVFFWMLTAVYAVLSARRSNWSLERIAASTLALGLIAHLNFLSLSLIADDSLSVSLAAPYFMYYVRGVLLLILLVANTIGFSHLRKIHREPPFWLAAAYLPVATLLLGPLRWSVPAVAAAAVAVFAFPYISAWTERHDAWNRLKHLAAHPGVFVVAILLLGGVMRLTAALRLASMGTQTVMLNADDPPQYDANARGLVAGTGVVTNASLGYSLCLATLYGLAGRNFTRVLAIQAIIPSSVPAAVYWLGRRSCGEQAARIAAVLAALSQLLIFNSVNLAREMISLVLVMPMVGFLISCSGHSVAGHIPDCPAVKQLGVSRTNASSATTTAWWSIVTRSTPYALAASQGYSRYADELYKRGINPFGDPFGSIAHAAQQPFDVLVLEVQKVWLDFRRFFFEGFSGLFFPLLLVKNSFFSGHIFFYGVMSAIIGFGVTIRKILAGGEEAWYHGMIYLTMAAYSGVYIVFFFGITRFRATVHPIILLWIGFGLSGMLTWVKANAGNDWDEAK